MFKKSKKIGYLGPKGTFTQQAAEILNQGNLGIDYVSFRDTETIFMQVSQEICAAGVVPLENSTEGAVNITLDSLIATENIVITSMLSLPINHALMSAGEAGGIKNISAHPQALAQCKKYLQKFYPEAKLISAASNSEACELAYEEGKTYAAIGPAACADIYGLNVLSEGIQDYKVNNTLFIQIGLSDTGKIYEGCCISIAFSTLDEPGALYRLLGIFSEYNVNMTKILSRPLPGSPGKYIFFADIEGYEVAAAKKALAKLEKETTMYKFLGCYKREDR